MPLTPPRTIGAISTTASSPVSPRDPTAGTNIAPGCCAEGWRHDALWLRHDDLRRDSLRRADEPLPSRAEAALERQRERADRALRGAARPSAFCRRTRRRLAARAARAVLRGASLPAARRAAGEARPCASRPNRLPHRTRHHRRRHHRGRGPRTRPLWPRSARLAGMPRARVWRSLSHEHRPAGFPRRSVFRTTATHHRRRPGRSDLDARGELTMPRLSSQSVAIQSSGTCVPSFFPAIAAHPDRRSGSHHARRFRRHLHAVIMVALFAPCGIANAQPVAAQSTVTSKSDRIERFVAEAALRFGIPTSWITAVMQAESRGVVRAVSPKGAMGLMQIMPDTWSGLRSRYGLGADPFDPHDNILAGAAYLRELHDRYGAIGFLAAYNAGPGRYEDHLATGHPLPAETQAYVAALAPLLRDDGSMGNVITAIIRSWTSSPFFPVRANDASSTGGTSSGDLGKRRSMVTPATDWTGLAPQSEGLFAPVSERQPRL